MYPFFSFLEWEYHSFYIWLKLLKFLKSKNLVKNSISIHPKRKELCVVVIPFGFMNYLPNPHLTYNYWVSDANCTTQQCHFPHVSLKPFSWGFNRPGLFQAPSWIHFLRTKPPIAFIISHIRPFLVCFYAHGWNISHLELAIL